jgi:hypothetical protein
MGTATNKARQVAEKFGASPQYLALANSEEELIDMIAKWAEEELDPVTLWEFVRQFVIAHERDKHAEAMSEMLGKIDSEKMADAVCHNLTFAQIGVYWHLFPERLKTKLDQLGIGPKRPRRSSARNNASREQQQKNASKERQEHGWKKSDQQSHSTRLAVRIMTKRFGFSRRMSYNEAKLRYWQLASELHPDRTENRHSSIEKIKELNYIWSKGKSCFA